MTARGWLVVVAVACAVAGGCDRRTWTGPLAPAADSVFAAPPDAPCDTASVYYELDDVARPLRG